MDRRIPEPPDLTSAILARTSGSPCLRLRELACAYVDGDLDGGPRALADAHLAHCPGCAALVAALREAEAVLPALGGVDPGPWFAAQVLRATVKASAPTGFWSQLMHRPRIALESAFLGAAAGMMGLALPLPAGTGVREVPALAQPVETTLRQAVDQASAAGRRLAARGERTVVRRIRWTKALGTRVGRRVRGWVHRGELPRSEGTRGSANP